MKYVRRLIFYIASRLFIVCLVLGLMTTAFYYAMNASNIYILLKDGMAKRAQVIMMGGERSSLQNYFSNTYLEHDAALKDAEEGLSVYQNFYQIKGIDHRLNMTYMWCWPWEDTARAVIEEKIPLIDGKMIVSKKEEAKSYNLTSDVPKWSSAKYSVVLTKENGHFKIKNLTLMELLND